MGDHVNDQTPQDKSNDALGDELIARGSSTTMRVALAYKHNLDVDVMRILAEDASFDVRITLMGNPNVPEDLLWEGGYSFMESIRAAVARNPSSPPALVHMLAGDDSRLVRDWARSNVSFVPGSKVKRLPNILLHPDLPPEVMERIVLSGDVRTKFALMKNPVVPIRFIRLLMIQEVGEMSFLALDAMMDRAETNENFDLDEEWEEQ